MDNEAKFFDLGDLEAKLKEKGLPEIKGLGKAIVDAVFEWISDSVKASPTPLDDLSLALLPPLKAYIDSKIDEA